MQQWDGSYMPIEACTCEPAWIDRADYINVFCPIERHATVARQNTWSFDDQGTIYTDSTE